MQQARRTFIHTALYAMAIALVVAACAVAFFLRSQSVLKTDLQEKLMTYATLSAARFTAQEIEAIQGEEDMGTPLFRELVARTKSIKNSLPDVTFVYVMRRTQDPMQLEFVLEDDMLDTIEELDENGDGILQADEKVVVPGELFDISDVPAMQHDAFVGPAVDAKITHDQWGSWISAYAPIRDAQGNTVAILGVDMDAEHFMAATLQVLSPAALQLGIGGIVLLMSSFTYILWRRRALVHQLIEERRHHVATEASHKLGNPIASLRWWLELLEEPLEEADAAAARQELSNATDRLWHAVEELNAAESTEETEEEIHARLAAQTEQELSEQGSTK